MPPKRGVFALRVTIPDARMDRRRRRRREGNQRAPPYDFPRECGLQHGTEAGRRKAPRKPRLLAPCTAKSAPFPTLHGRRRYHAAERGADHPDARRRGRLPVALSRRPLAQALRADHRHGARRPPGQAQASPAATRVSMRSVSTCSTPIRSAACTPPPRGSQAIPSRLSIGVAANASRKGRSQHDR